MSNFQKCIYSLAQDQYSNLTLGALGLWHFLINQRRGWDLTPESIASRSDSDLDEVKKLLRELADKKLLDISKNSDGSILYKLKSNVIETTTRRLAMGSSASGRPSRENYSSDEEFEQAFYEWNTIK